MSDAIDPGLLAEPGLRDIVRGADDALRADFARPAEGRAWKWVRDPHGVTLTMSYEGNSLSRGFDVEKLRNTGDVVWEAHDLWQDLLLANIRRSSGKIVDVLREIEREQQLQGA